MRCWCLCPALALTIAFCLVRPLRCDVRVCVSPQNRELQIMGIMDHCDVISLKHCFYSKGEKVSMFDFFLQAAARELMDPPAGELATAAHAPIRFLSISFHVRTSAR
jgi:hypothetical protein